MVILIIAVLSSYVFGSIPTAYLFGRVLKGVDIRKFGSGNVGATNAMRVLGKGAGITVLLLDILKGVLPVVILGHYVLPHVPFISAALVRIILGVACICGHNWTIFLNFNGGKGVATTLGVLLGLSFTVPWLGVILVLAVLTWMGIFLYFKIISVASVVSAILFPLYVLAFMLSPELIIASVVLAIFVVARHRSNIQRFFKGQEKRISFKKTASIGK